MLCLDNRRLKINKKVISFSKAPGGSIRWRAWAYNNTQKAQLLLTDCCSPSFPHIQ